MDATTAAYAVSLGVAVSAVGRLVTGWLSTRMAVVLLAVILGAPLVARLFKGQNTAP